MNRTIAISLGAIVLGSSSFLLPADILDPEPAAPVQTVSQPPVPSPNGRNGRSAVPSRTEPFARKPPVDTGHDSLGPLDGRRFKGGSLKSDD